MLLPAADKAAKEQRILTPKLKRELEGFSKASCWGLERRFGSRDGVARAERWLPSAQL